VADITVLRPAISTRCGSRNLSGVLYSTMETSPSAPPTTVRRWLPRRVLITAAAADQPHTAEVIRRCAAAGVTDIETLAGGSPEDVFFRLPRTIAENGARPKPAGVGSSPS